MLIGESKPYFIDFQEHLEIRPKSSSSKVENISDNGFHTLNKDRVGLEGISFATYTPP